MKLYVPFILISTLLFKKILCQQNLCQVVEMERGEIYLTKRSSPLIIETDDNDYNKLNYSEYSIIRQQARIQNFEVKQIISNLILPPFTIDSIFEKLYCYLRKSQYYFISCIKESNFKQNTRQNIQDQSIILIKLNIQEDNICHEFFFNQHVESHIFHIFCIQSFELNIYSVNFESQTTLLSKLNIEQYDNDGCKRSYSKPKDFLYLIVFYQCSNWGIFTYTNNTINLALNEEIALSIYFQQIKLINNFELCQHNVFLIVETGYYQFGINNQNQFYFQLQISNHPNLMQLILSQSCNLVYYIQYSALDNKTVIYNNKRSQQFDGIAQFNAYLFQNILFIQINNQLQVIYNIKFQQVININSSIIYINTQFNIINQLDLISDELIFYELCYPRTFFRPTKTFVYLIYSQSTLFELNDRCYKISYNLKQSIQSNKTLHLDDICQHKFILYYSKKGLNLMNQYQIDWPQSSDFNISIFDNQKLNQSCSIQQHVFIKDYTLLQYNIQYQFLLFKTDKYIYKYNCNGQQQLIINIKSSKVYQYKNSIFIWDDQRMLRLFNFQTNETKAFKFKFESEIIDIIQCKNIIIVYTQNQKEVQLLDFDTQEFSIINLQVQRMLNKIFDVQRQNNSPIQPFYFARFPLLFFQFHDQLIIVRNKEVHSFQIDQTQVVLFKAMVFDNYYLFGVHLNNNQLIEYKLDFEQISILNDVDLNPYEIVRPLEYQINENYFCIAVQNDMRTFILLFAILKQLPLKLLHSIQIGRISFFFQEQYLIYYDKEDNIILFNMEDFEIQIDNVVQFQSQTKRFNFNVVPINSNESSISLQFTLIHYNNCYQLFKKTNNTILYYSFLNKTKIQPTNYFSGPIDSFNVLEKDAFQMDGPLLFSKVSLEAEGAKINRINLNTIFSDMVYFRIIYLQFKNDTILFFKKENNYILQIEEITLLDIILINPQSILIIFRKNKTENLRGIIYQIDEITYQLKKEPLFEISLFLQNIDKEFQSMKIGNLIVIKWQSTLLIYQIVGFRLELITNEFSIIEFIKIKGNNQLYVSLSIEDNDILKFQILLLNGFQFESKVTATLSYETIRTLLNNYINYYRLVSLYNFDKIKLLECLIEDGQAKITLSQMIEQTLVISEIIILLKNSNISYNLLKIARNNIKSYGMQLVYYCQNTLVVSSLTGETYFYDLTESQILTDYIGRQTGVQSSYYVLNTTHLIIYSNFKDKIFVAEIGYEISVKEGYSGNNTFTLVAENMLSQIQLNVTMLDINQIKKIKTNYNFIIIYLLVFVLILVLYFLIRRMKLKWELLNNQKIDRIKLNNQEQ